MGNLDPNAVLNTIRALMDSTDDVELREAIEDLDNWLSRGGFLPEDWARTRLAVVKDTKA